jgi:hypothetical protein
MKQGRYRHLREEQIRQIQMDVDEEWEKLKQRAGHSRSREWRSTRRGS